MRCLKNFFLGFEPQLKDEKKDRNNAGHTRPVITPALVVAFAPVVSQ